MKRLCFFFLTTLISSTTLDLSSLPWYYVNPLQFFSTNIPNDIFSDMYKNEKIPNPYYGNNNEEWRFLTRNNNTYFTIFNLTEVQINKTIVIEFKGLDAISTVYLNEQYVGRTENMFRTYSFLINSTILMKKENGLMIVFESPVDYAQKKFDDYKNATGNAIPPIEVPKVQRGDPHVNFIRKTQSSFSWDWGPSFPTQGVYQPIFLHAYTDFKLASFSPYVSYKDNGFYLTSRVDYYCTTSAKLDLLARISISELNFTKTYKKSATCHGHANYFTFSSPVESANIELWYPRMYGNQKIYNVTVKVTGNREEGSLSKLVGFKKVELDQGIIDKDLPEKGKNFAYYVNGIPVFLKGANMVPASLFPSKFTKENMDFLIYSVTEANMNTLRIWGGGEWLRDEFIEMTDKAGILVFHDLMFACALYPTDKEFIDNVQEEVKQQLEAAIRQQWWPSEKYNERKQEEDYIKFMTPILKTVNEFYSYGIITRSSPSNGDLELKVDVNPNSEFYGDIHFYNEMTNLWKPYNLPIPRCATEFGVPSFPMPATLKRYVDEEEYSYFSKSMIARNRHFLGLFTLPLLVANHFTFDVTQPLGVFSYLTQVHQAITLKTQIEHYRSQRSILNNEGKGNTMCALYWQLNDVWAGITWSSMDFEQRWKVAHYYVKKAFEDVTITMSINQTGNLNVFVIDDLLVPLKDAKVVIQATTLNSKFARRVLSEIIVDVPALSSKEIPISISGDIDLTNSFIEGVLKTDGQTKVNVLPPNYLSEYSLVDVEAMLTGIAKIDSSTFKLKLKSSDVIPYVWLDLSPRLLKREIQYHFSDNGFIMLDSSMTVYLYIIHGDVDYLTENDITVCWVYNCQ